MPGPLSALLAVADPHLPSPAQAWLLSPQGDTRSPHQVAPGRRHAPLGGSLRKTQPLQPSGESSKPLPLSLDSKTPEAALTVGDVAPHLILGHDQVLGDSLLLLLVFARHLPTATTAASLSLSCGLRLPSHHKLYRVSSIREESASKQGNRRAGRESEKLRARGLRRRAHWDNESYRRPVSSRPRGV